MSSKASDFDELFVLTVLADLFDPSGSDDPNHVAQKILEGLEKNQLINNNYEEDNDLLAA